MSPETPYPFSGIVGHEDAKLALELAVVDPMIGGVLLRGEKGSAKTTLARGLARLLGEGAPFVDLPLGATEDRLIGTLEVAAALTGAIRFDPGLLAAAHGGVLYVDEVNLLADHLVDVLLDVAASGVNVVEREGVSHRHDARFVLIGSMNPEEGELRPQLLDRFGLCVEITAPREVPERVEIVRRRLDHDSGRTITGDTDDAELSKRLRRARPAEVPEPLLEAAARLAVAVGAEGLRADITLCRAAAALAGLEGRAEAGADDLSRVAPLVLSHRARRAPFDPPTLTPDSLERAMSEALDDRTPPAPSTPDDSPTESHARERTLLIGAERTPPIVEHARETSTRGRFVRPVPAGDAPGAPIALLPTVRELARRRADDPDHLPSPRDLRASTREVRAGRLLVLAVDLSGSMGARARAEAATGSVLGLLTHAYQQRDQVALVGFRGSGAEVLLTPTTSIEVAHNRLGSLSTGGTTPLAEGIRAALRVAIETRTAGSPLVVLLTDGRATGDADAMTKALHAAAEVRRARIASLVLDCETGTPRLRLAARLADAMGARYAEVGDPTPSVICSIIGEASDAAVS